MKTAHEQQMELELKKLDTFIKDAHAYLRHSFREGTRDSIILSTLAHDIGGLARKDRCFLPRVTGYRNRMEPTQ